MKILPRRLLPLTTLVAVFFSSHALHGQQLKIASVDMTKVFSDYYKTKKADAELKDRANGYDKELRERDTELKKLGEEGKKLQEDVENPALAEDKRMEKRKALEAKVIEFRLAGQTLQDMTQSRKRELSEMQNRVRDTLVEEITKVIQEKAKRDGYTLVVDKTGRTLSGVSPFLYVQDSLDITADIIKTLNAGAPATPVAGGEKSKEKK